MIKFVVTLAMAAPLWYAAAQQFGTWPAVGLFVFSSLVHATMLGK